MNSLRRETRTYSAEGNSRLPDEKVHSVKMRRGYSVPSGFIHLMNNNANWNASQNSFWGNLRVDYVNPAEREKYCIAQRRMTPI